MINIEKFKKSLKIRFKNKSLLIKSLTHKSANQNDNNEKLEFLGDRVIGLVLANKLFDLYPNENEGVLDKRFASLVNRKICFEIGCSIRLEEYIIIANKKKVEKTDEKIISDACEALIGALFIDQGFNYTKDFILKIWKNHIARTKITILDSKTKLQEHSLKKYKKLPFYKMISFSGPKHNPIFKISVSINESKKIIGSGRSKQQAQQDGASKLIKLLNIN